MCIDKAGRRYDNIYCNLIKGIVLKARGERMKTYQEIKVIVTLLESDVVTSSGGEYEGVSELNPSTAPDWFDKK